MNQTPAWGSLLHTLYGIEKVRVDAGFEDLLSNKINIPPGIRSTASDSQNHLRDFLSRECLRDTNFPRVLSKIDSDFLGGSFARHTKTWPLDDIDLYVPLDGHNLFYMQNGQRLPYVVQSDGILLRNPLLTERWANGQYVSSAKLLLEFSRVLARHYRGSDVRINGNRVSIRMKQGASADSDGLGYDIVPCFSLKPDRAGEFEVYLIADGYGGWTRTNPRLDADVCEILQAFHNKIYRKVVKLVKYWNETRLVSNISSYYIEFAICTEFLNRKVNNQPFSRITEGLAAAFDALDRAFMAGDQTSWIANAPPIRKPLLTASQSGLLKFARNASELACIYEGLGKDGESREQWRSVFGDFS
jgi:hypothetical protein